MKKAIVVGGSRGIGKAINEGLVKLGYDTIATSKDQLDTSILNSVKQFVKNHQNTDVLILNTGGPPAKDFFSIITTN